MIYFVMIALTPRGEDRSPGDTGEPWNPPSVELKWQKLIFLYYGYQAGYILEIRILVVIVCIVYRMDICLYINMCSNC